jgi:hypothetical protein
VPTFAGRERERLIALAEVDGILYPEWPVLEETTYANALRGRITATRRDQLGREQRVAHDAFLRCVRAALAAGDLELPRSVTLDHLIFTLATFSTGLFAPISRGLPDLAEKRSDPTGAMRRLGSAFLDGIGWKPLTSEWNYHATLDRIYSECFPPAFLDELGLVSSRPINQARPQRTRARRRPAQE